MKETLSAKQARFTLMIGKLILWAYGHDYRLTFGDAYAKTGHMKESVHYIRLAVDFNLFKRDLHGRWRYCTSTEAHRPLGDYWKSIGGAWGGNFKKRDGNHYSLEHAGRK